ncbi:hypothetical protein UlMin_041144 [Ulmus minor]
MGRSPCCEKVGLKKGPWTPEEDQKLLAYIEEHGHGSWRALPAKAGLQRCGKSCRLRWTNYLRPDIKRGKFSLQEEQTIIQLHALLGNRWSAIATHLPKRTDNEIKNYWNTHLKKRLTKMGIDPVTHKPKANALGSGSGNPKDAANLSHMAQWESARLEAEARLVKESKLITNNNPPLPPPHHHFLNRSAAAAPPCLDVLKVWQGAWTKSTRETNTSLSTMMAMDDLESPTSTLNFPDAAANFPIQTLTFGPHETAAGTIEFKDNNSTMSFQDITFGCTDNTSAWFDNESVNVATLPALSNIMEGFGSDVFVYNSDDNTNNSLPNSSNVAGERSENGGGASGGIIFEENKSYWNSILNLVNTSPAGSPVF